MSSTKRDIETLIREDDWKKALEFNKFDGKLLNSKINENF